MTIYYTAKDIEEMAAKGIYVLELGPETSLTDFARETAEQLEISLIERVPDKQVPDQGVGSGPISQAEPASISSSYNKPRGCQRGNQGVTTAKQVVEQPVGAVNQANSTPVNRLVDLMGKIINRGE